MRLGFKKRFFLLFAFLLGGIALNCISISASFFGFVSIPEIAANDVRLMKKDSNGFARVDLMSKDTSYLSTSRENVYSISSFRNGDTSFATFQENVSFDYACDGIDLTIPTIGLTNQKSRLVPLGFKELDFCKGNYLKNQDLFIGSNGCVLSESYANIISSELGIPIEDIIGKEIKENSHKLVFSIVSIVENESFVFSCFPGIFDDGFIATDFSLLSKIQKSTFHLYLTDEYNQNFSIFYKVFSSIYHLNTLPYLQMNCPNNPWFQNEIDSFLIGRTKNIGNIVLIICEIFFLAFSVIFSFLVKNHFLELKADILHVGVIIFTFSFLMISIFLSFLMSHMVLFGYHINTQSSTAFTISLINVITIISAFLIVNNILKNKRNEFVSDFYVLEI